MKLFIFVAILTTIIIQNGSCGKLKKVVKKLEATVEAMNNDLLAMNSQCFMGNVPITESNHLDTFHNWGRDFKVEFDIKVLSTFTTTWLNVFRMTSIQVAAKGPQEGDYCGKRLPALFINKDGYLHITSSISGGNCNHVYNFDYGLNKKYHYEIIQTTDNSNVNTYTVKIDGKVMHGPIVNTEPTLFEEVHLYASDQYTGDYGTALGYAELSNLCITNLHHY